MTEQESPQPEKDEIHVGDVTDSKGIAIGPSAQATVVEGDLVISVGHRRIAIPRIVQIAVAVVTLGVIFLVASQVVNFQKSSRPARMEGDFNIAVAQFQVVGEGEGLDDAQDLAQSFANAIDREMQGLATELEQRIEVRPPNDTGAVAGKTEGERAKSAHALAETINAHVVIYGTIEVHGMAAMLRPEFYVRSDEFADAAEVTGQYRMGSMIALDKVDNIARKSELGNILANRSRALTFIVYGLANFVIGEYDIAETNFNQALDIEGWDNPDVIYVMLGNTRFKQNDWITAEWFYKEALRKNPLYSRAFIGLGSVLYVCALGDEEAETYDTVNIELLAQSIETYQQALDPGLEQPPLAGVTIKANYGLGQAYLLKALVEAENSRREVSQQELMPAVEAFQVVIQDCQEDRNFRTKELTAHAHAHLGLIFKLSSQFERAISEYEQALELLPSLDRTEKAKASYKAALAELYAKRSQPSAAVLSSDTSEQKDNSDTVAPSDVKQELFASVVLPSPPIRDKDCLDDIYYHPSTFHFDPTIIGESIFLPNRTLSPESTYHASEAKICGYEEYEAIRVLLTNPFGEVLLEIGATAYPESYHYRDTRIIPTYCYYILHEIRAFDFLPEDPLGEYTVEVVSKNAHLVFRFELKSLANPVIYYSNRLDGFVIAGFEPFEEVRVLEYSLRHRTGPGVIHYTFVREDTIQLDESGIDFLNDHDSEAELFVVREGLDFISSGSRSVPLNYDKIVELNPTDAYAFYYRGIYDHSYDDWIPDFRVIDEYNLGYRYDNAIFDFTKAIELDSDFALAYFGRGRIHGMLGNFHQAASDFSKVIQLDPAYAAAYYERGIAHSHLSDYVQAILDLTQAIELDPAYVPAYYARARLYDRKGEHRQAGADLMRAIELDQDREYGDISDYDTAIRLAPDFFPAYYERANILRRKCEYGLAIRDYGRVIDLAPEHLHAFYARARLLDGLGEYNWAIADYSKIIELSPGYWPVYYHRAYLYAILNDYDRAIEDYGKVIELASAYSAVPAYYARARLYCSRNESNECLADLSQAIELDQNSRYGSIGDYSMAIELKPDYALAYYRRGVVRKWDESDQAIADLTNAIELDPDYLPAYEERALRYDRQGEYDKAITDYTKIVGMNPRDIRAYYSRGQVYSKQGNYDQAIADFNKAIELDPSSASAYYARACFFEQQGYHDQAISDFELILKLNNAYPESYWAKQHLKELKGE